MIQTEIGYTTPDTISVRGKNLATELLGHIDFVDMIIFVFYGRLPEAREKAMLNLLLVLTTDHGLTPSAVSARLESTRIWRWLVLKCLATRSE